MKIHCICLVKDEEDILEQTVTAARQWADHVFIADNGSSDKTLDIVDRLVDGKSILKMEGYDKVPYREGLCGLIYNQVKSLAQPGDWWCRLDADEFYLDDPREFLAAMPQRIDTVWSSHYSYQFTDVDYARYKENPEKFLATPLKERFKYYMNSGGEARFVKHQFPYYWKGPWPNYRFCSSERRIRIQQYQYRSPEQILVRLKNRQNLHRSFSHEAMDGIQPSEWLAKRIHPSHTLDYDDGGPLIERVEAHYAIWPLKPKNFPYSLWVAWMIIQRILIKLGLKSKFT